MDMSATFAEVYAEGRWAEGSGVGSYAQTTLGWRKFLTGYLTARNIKSVVDLGCGDWQTAKLIDWDGIDYVGIDCVPEVISSDDWCYAAPGVRFILADITTCDLPPADLIIVKDVLQHWPNDVVAAFLQRLGGRRALIVNDSADDANHDCPLGGWRAIDITKPPFDWSARTLGFWSPGEKDGKVAWCKVVQEIGGPT